jgi:predicted RNA-binding Zn ribbon-like protein
MCFTHDTTEAQDVHVRLDDYRWGAQVATDLINTAPDVMVSTGDGLADPDALSRFLVEHGVWPDGVTASPTAADLADVHQLRRILRGLIEAPDESRLVAGAGALAARAGVGLTLERDDSGQWQWYVASGPEAGPADELALLTAAGLLAVMRILGPGRFRGCSLPGCNGMFVDTSRGGRRRYCEPEVCGSRAHAASYRARQRAAQDMPIERG